MKKKITPKHHKPFIPGVIKSEKCSPVNSPVDPNLGSTPNPQPSTPHSRHSDGGRSSVGLLQSPSSLPNISTATTIFKCNNCDFFAETKQDMEMHIDNVHPNCLDSDYMTIPTNSTALIKYFPIERIPRSI